ncbi:adenine nucleotide alpha hydrolase family protein [Candidatus Woesearchaeota archaeon]|nr:adenine nucleotide alpha hydrolase family protein [Candidatus Woesearchaeota archaeon]
MIKEKIARTIGKYRLLNKNDKIAVAVSGGKDSTTILYILKQLGYNVEALHIDVGIRNFSRKNLDNVKHFCAENKIKLHVFSYKNEYSYSLPEIQQILVRKNIKLKNCSVCGVLRRNLLNKKARTLGFDKLVTGHNLDDAAQEFLMNLFTARLSLSARLGPKTGLIDSKGFVPRVKPMYFIREKEIERFSKKQGFNVNYCACPLRALAYRNMIRIALDNYEKENKNVKENITGYFLKIMPWLEKRYENNKEINKCRSCGESCKDEICMKCVILGNL